MSDADEERELALAIALSMQQSPARIADPNQRSQHVVDLTSDTEDEDEDLRKAIALSLRDSASMPASNESNVEESGTRRRSRESVDRKISASATKARDASQTLPKIASGVLGLDRKAMEQERLARLGKRKREPSPPRPPKARSNTLNGLASQGYADGPSGQTAVLQYPGGTIKRTFATKFPRTNDVTIDEVLQAESVNIAVISSFMWDSEWLNGKLNPLRTKQIWIMNAKGDDVQQRWRQEMKDCGIPNLKLHFPPMHGMIHSMHSKFMLLFGKEKLRIVVASANMTPIDWGEVMNDWQPGVMENSVFIIDLPRIDDAAIQDLRLLTAFGKELVHFLRALELDEKVVEGVLKFDFSQTGHMAFVHSIGGAHKGENDHATGLPGLSRSICDLHLDNVQHLELDYAASSLGAVNDIFLQRVYLAASGLSFGTSSNIPSVQDHIRVYFPTDSTVKKSIGGPDCGGVITLAMSHYSASTFPRGCLRNYDSTRRGMLSHNKLLFARGRKIDGQAFAWVLVGSANLSESAWGGQKILKNGQMGTLNIRNWECGVLMPVSSDKLKSLQLAEGEAPPMSVFHEIIEVPFVFPGQRYGDEKPWIFR